MRAQRWPMKDRVGLHGGASVPRNPSGGEAPQQRLCMQPLYARHHDGEVVVRVQEGQLAPAGDGRQHVLEPGVEKWEYAKRQT